MCTQPRWRAIMTANDSGRCLSRNHRRRRHCTGSAGARSGKPSGGKRSERGEDGGCFTQFITGKRALITEDDRIAIILTRIDREACSLHRLADEEFRFSQRPLEPLRAGTRVGYACRRRRRRRGLRAGRWRRRWRRRRRRWCGRRSFPSRHFGRLFFR